MKEILAKMKVESDFEEENKHRDSDISEKLRKAERVMQERED